MRAVLALVTAVVLLPFTAVSAVAAEPVGTTTTLVGTAGHAGEETTLTVTVVDEEGAPVPDRPVTINRRQDGGWSKLHELVTDAAGQAVVTAPISRRPRDNFFAARHTGDETYASSGSGRVQVELVPRDSRLRLRGPDSVVDEQEVTLRISWRARGTLEGISGRVWLQRRQAAVGAPSASCAPTPADGRRSPSSRAATSPCGRWHVASPGCEATGAPPTGSTTCRRHRASGCHDGHRGHASTCPTSRAARATDSTPPSPGSPTGCGAR